MRHCGNSRRKISASRRKTIHACASFADDSGPLAGNDHSVASGRHGSW